MTSSDDAMTDQTQPEQSVSAATVEAAEKVVVTAQRAYDAEPGIEMAMLLDAARRRLYLARRECRS
jgi:hypothetical protein